MNDNAIDESDERAPVRMFNGRRIPPKATHYRLTRENGEQCTFGVRDGIVCNEWPVSELVPQLLEERFGPGEYSLTWVIHKDDGTVTVAPRMRGTFVIKAAPRVAASAPVAAVTPPPAGFTCCNQAWPAGIRFCGLCATPSPHLAPVDRVVPQAGGVGLGILDGMKFAFSAIQQANEMARAESERKLAQERQDHDLRMDRQRQQFELDSRAQEERYARREREMQTMGAAAPSAVDAQVIGALKQLDARLSELDERVEDVGDAAEEASEKVKSGFESLVGIVKTLEPVLTPLAQGLISKMTQAPAATNGAAKA